MGNECQYCDFYSREIEKLKQENEKIKKCVEFYADSMSWEDDTNGSFRMIMYSDIYLLSDTPFEEWVGGALAVKTLKEIEESK